MPWQKVDLDLPDHRKTIALGKAIREHPYYAAGLLLKVWAWAIRHAKDGYVDPDRHAESLAKSLGTRSDRARNLLRSMSEVGWIDEGSRFHEWDEWGGKVVRDAELDARRKRLDREHRRDGHPMFIEGCPKCVRGTSSGQGGSRNGLRPVDIHRTEEPVSTGPAGGRPGVEERRVDTPYPRTGPTDTTWAQERGRALVDQAEGAWRVVLQRLLEEAQGEGTWVSFVTYLEHARLEERGEGYAVKVVSELHQSFVVKHWRMRFVELLGTDDVTIEVGA